MMMPRTSSIVVPLAMVVLTPPVAWLVWVSWSDGKASDAMHVAWFATVALGCVLAGALADRTRLLVIAGAAILSTIVTLFVWWSSEDESGLFLVGIIIATPLVVAASLPLLLLGHALKSVGRSRRT
jgi:hypothetical protein